MFPVLKKQNINDLFVDAMRSGDEDRPLIYFDLTTISYRNVFDRWRAVARGLRAVGVGRGDRVVTVTPNLPPLLPIIFGITAVGAVYAPLMQDATAEEMEYFFSDVEAKAVIITAEQFERLRDVLARSKTEVVLIANFGVDPRMPGEHPSNVLLLDDVIRAADRADVDWSAVRPHDDLTILYTSGTTGRPKGIVLQHEGFGVQGQLQAHWMGFQPGETVLGTMPLFHIAGLHMCLGTALVLGGGYMMQEKFSVSRFWRDVDFSRCVGGITVPLVLAALMNQPPRTDDNSHTLRRVVSQFAPAGMKERFGIDVRPLWTMTEVAGSSTWTHPNEEQVAHMVGWPIHHDVELAIWDDNQHPVGPGTRGEIVCKSPWLFKEYWNKPEQTAATKVNGWVRSGDLGYMDESGRLFYVDRLKNMIKRAGENIAALEVEGVIRRLEAVGDVACFGVPDPIRGEEVKVVLTVTPGANLSELDVIEWCTERLSPFKVPRFVQIRDELPRTHTLKPNLGLLKNEHLATPGWDRSQHANPN